MAAASAENVVPSGRPAILLVESHADTADLYAWALQRAGFHVERADSQWPPADGLAADLIIAHMRQPDIGAVANLNHPKRAPIVVLTAWIAPGMTAAVLGCDALMMIPLDPDTLVQKAWELLGVRPEPAQR